MQNRINYTELAESVAEYIRHRQNSNVAEIERILADSYQAQKASLWRYDKARDALESLSDPQRSIALEKSLTQKAVRTEKPLLCSHVSSDPQYRKSIDNPYDLSLRNLLFYPVTDDQEEVVGLVVLYRTTHSRRNFTPVYLRELDTIKPLMQPLWIPDRVSPEEIETIVAKLRSQTQQSTQDKPKNTKVKIEKPKTTEQDRQTVRELQQRIETLQTELETEQKRHQVIKRENQRLQTIVDELSSELKTLQIDYNSAQKEIKLLRSRLEQNRQETRASLPESRQADVCQATVLFERTPEKLTPYPVAFTLGEYILHAADSEKYDTLRHIEQLLARASVLEQLTDTVKLTSLLNEREKKYDPKSIVAFIETFSRSSRENQVKIAVTHDEPLPLLLSFDLAKVYEVLSHLMYDFFEVGDAGSQATFHLSYVVNPTQTKKALSMHLEGALRDEGKTTRFRLLGKKTNENDRERVHIDLAKQIASTMRGSIRAVRDAKTIRYEFTLPVRILT